MRKIVGVLLALIISMFCCFNLMACENIASLLPGNENSGLKDDDGDNNDDKDNGDSDGSDDKDNGDSDGEDNDDGGNGDNSEDPKPEDKPLTQQEKNDKSIFAITNSAMALGAPLLINKEAKFFGTFVNTVQDADSTTKTEFNYKVHLKSKSLSDKKDLLERSLTSVNYNDYDYAFQINSINDEANKSLALDIILPHKNNANEHFGYLNTNGNKVKLEYSKIIELITSIKTPPTANAQNNFIKQSGLELSSLLDFSILNNYNYNYEESEKQIIITTSDVKDNITTDVILKLTKSALNVFTIDNIETTSTVNSIKTTKVFTISAGSFNILEPINHEQYFNVANINKAIADMQHVTLGYNYDVVVGDSDEKLSGTYAEYSSEELLEKQYKLSSDLGSFYNLVGNPLMQDYAPDTNFTYLYQESSQLDNGYLGCTPEYFVENKLAILQPFLNLDQSTATILLELSAKQFSAIDFSTENLALTVTVITHSLNIAKLTFAVDIDTNGKYYFTQFKVSIFDNFNAHIYSINATFDSSLVRAHKDGFDYLFNEIEYILPME